MDGTGYFSCTRRAGQRPQTGMGTGQNADNVELGGTGPNYIGQGQAPTGGEVQDQVRRLGADHFFAKPKGQLKVQAKRTAAVANL